MRERLDLSPRLRDLLRRGAIILGGLLAVALLGIAVLIASRDYSAIERGTLTRLEEETGAVFRFESRRHVLWPKPKIVFEAVSLARPGERPLLKAPQAILNFDLVDFIDGNIDGPVVTLLSPEIVVDEGRLDRHFNSPRAIAGIIETIAGAFDDRTKFSRLRVIVDQGRIVLPGAGPEGATLEFAPVNGRMRYSAARGRLDLTAVQALAEPASASATHPLSLSASLPTRKSVRGEKAQNASVQLSGFGSTLAFSGVMRGDPDLSLTGRLEATIGPALERLALPQTSEKRERVLEPTSMSATVTLDVRGIGLESVRISRADKQLGGTAALRELNGRWGVSGTLAGDLVDGSAANAALQGLRAKDGAWSQKPLSINPLPGIDLDIRLSTREFRLGNVLLGNVALSILTRPGRAELAVVDSRFGNGTIKARVALAESPDGTQDLRLQASGDRVDVGRLGERAFGFSRLAGEGTLVVQAEGRGASVAALVASLAGAGAIDIRSGELAGIDLQRLLNRSADARPEAALVLALGGKTPFDHLKANFALKDGRVEPVGSTFSSARVDAMLEGLMDLGAQRHQLAIVLRRKIDEPGQPGEFYAFRLDGPLFAPTIKPDLKLLLNRS